MRSYLIVATLFLSTSVAAAQTRPVVRTGIDVLREHNFDLLKGKRVGLITNPTGVSRDLQPTADILAAARSVKLVALFGPEHGVRGDATAGSTVANAVDPVTGLPEYSLYGRTTKPTAEMLKGIDVLVYDIQDIGCRAYTYISTMASAMDAAAENNVEFVVLDRPNPVGGDRIEGNVLQMEYKSFVGMFPVPYLYGLTCGELATMINGEGWLAGGRKCRLTVEKMEGWTRSMSWEETGLPWVPTSPHIPNAPTALYCAATGILGELDDVNVGVGYTMPFQIIGAPWIDGRRFAAAMNALHLPGVAFRPMAFRPFYGGMEGKEVHGAQLYILDRRTINLTSIQLHAIAVIDRLYPDSGVFVRAGASRLEMFDKVMGTDSVRKELTNGTAVETIVSSWKPEIDRFRTLRKQYLLYQ